MSDDNTLNPDIEKLFDGKTPEEQMQMVRDVFHSASSHIPPKYLGDYTVHAGTSKESREHVFRGGQQFFIDVVTEPANENPGTAKIVDLVIGEDRREEGEERRQIAADLAYIKEAVAKQPVSGTLGKLEHSEDFRVITHYSSQGSIVRAYSFTGAQAAVAQIMWDFKPHRQKNIMDRLERDGVSGAGYARVSKIFDKTKDGKAFRVKFFQKVGQDLRMLRIP